MSLIEESVRAGVEEERCILTDYQTHPDDVHAFLAHLKLHQGSDWLPVHWEVEVADEWNGWFAGLALSFCDRCLQLHVVLPSPAKPVYEGEVPLDWRVVRLKRCRDGDSLPLFNLIVRRSALSIHWEVEWFEPPAGWKRSVARFLMPIINTILVENDLSCEEGRRSEKELVALFIEKNLRLLLCHGEKGRESFESLILDEGIRCSEVAKDQIKGKCLNGLQVDLAADHALLSETDSKPLKKAFPPPSRSRSGRRLSLCVVCLAQPLDNVAFVPCGHQVLCRSCLTDFQRRRDRTCPICRQPIQHCLTIFSA